MTEENTAPVKEEKTATAAPSNDDAKPSDTRVKASEQAKSDRSRGRRGRGGRKKEPKEFEETILGIDRVTRVTAGGRQMRFRVTVAIGDKKGRVGFGMGKSSEVMIGVQKAIAQAKKRMIKVPIINDTIPHAVNTKYKATKVFLLPAPEGKGVIAGGSVRKILELAGIKNVLSKLHGSRNKVTSAYATIKALQMLRNEAPPISKAAKAAQVEAAKKIAEAAGAAQEAKTEKKKAPAKEEAPKKAETKKTESKKEDK